MTELGDEELLRYSRQIVLREVGGRGQLRLRAASVVVVGAGGLGCPALMYLAGAGVGRLAVVDDDTVAVDNLPRQVLYTTADVGAQKAAAAAARLRAMNDGVRVEAVATRLSPENARDLLAGHDVVVECSDSFATKLDVADAATALGIPAVTGAAVGLDGQVLTALPGGPCYRCLVLEEPDPAAAPTCRQAGILGPVAGVVGAWQALVVLRLLLGADASADDRLQVLDALGLRLRSVPLAVDARCPNHG